MVKQQRKSYFLCPGTGTSVQRDGPRRIPKGDRKALWSRPQARNPFGKGYAPVGAPGGFAVAPWTPSLHLYCLVFGKATKKKLLPLPRYIEPLLNEMGPEGFQRATGKLPVRLGPFGRARRRETLFPRGSGGAAPKKPPCPPRRQAGKPIPAAKD